MCQPSVVVNKAIFIVQIFARDSKFDVVFKSAVVIEH